MSYPKLNLRPVSRRERFLQYVVNSARHAWVIAFPAITALVYFILAARSAKYSYMYLGMMFAMLAFIWFERNTVYHVLKRLQESESNSMHEKRPTRGADAATQGQGEGYPEGEEE